MTYLEWLKKDPKNSLILQTRFKKLSSYLANKYANYELKYPEQVFKYQYIALITEYENVLSSIETALEIRETTPITIDNLGKVSKVTRKDNSSTKGIDSTNYIGYNVEGEYERENKTNEFERDYTNQEIEYNLFEQLLRLENQGKRVAWGNFEKGFIKLFITLYTIMI